jgi:hypothetical protein
VPVVSAVVTGVATEKLDSYATDVTYALDLGVMAPLAVLAGILVLRRSALGILLTYPLLTLEASLILLIGAQTVSQLSAGVSLTPAQIAGPVGGFVALSVVAGFLLVRLLRGAGSSVRDRPPPTVIHGARHA